MHFSEQFQMGEKGHSLYDFVDIDLDRDNQLFIDPALIGLGSDPWSQKARECIDSFFDSLYAGFRKDDVRDLLSHAHEQNATKLGYGLTGVNGKGKTPDGLDYSMNNLKKLVQHIPTISQCEDLPVLVEGIAEDCMSDMLTNILHKHLNEFTASQMKKYGIPHDCIRSFFTWSVEEKTWKETSAPCWTYKGKEILLVPKWIVRRKYLFRAHQYLMVVIIERLRIEQSKNSSTKKEVWATLERLSDHWEYEYVKRYTQKHPNALAEYHRRLPSYYCRANGQLSDDDLDYYVYGTKSIKTA